MDMLPSACEIPLTDQGPGVCFPSAIGGLRCGATGFRQPEAIIRQVYVNEAAFEPFRNLERDAGRVSAISQAIDLREGGAPRRLRFRGGHAASPVFAGRHSTVTRYSVPLKSVTVIA